MAERGIGLSQKFGCTAAPAAPAAVSTPVAGVSGGCVLAGGAASSVAGRKSSLAKIDWRLKFAIAALLVAFAYATAFKFLKKKKGKAGESGVEGKKGGKEEEKEASAGSGK